jgi:hypothetical protein
MADVFWRRWRKEYLPLLSARQKWLKPNRSHKLGDVVLVTDQLLPRNQWCLGRIISVKADCKGYVRSATVKVCKHKMGGSMKIETTTLERPIQKLILLLDN